MKEKISDSGCLKKIVFKKFDLNLLSSINKCKEFVRSSLHLNPVNNVNLLCEKAYCTRHLLGSIVECGVFQGTSLFTLAAFCREHNIKKKIWGFDSFGGFPKGLIHPYDHPEYFEVLRKEGKITEAHYQGALKRTKHFNNYTHLKSEYFLDVKGAYRTASQFPSVHLVKGTFSETLPQFHEPISLLYIDCDLYKSYLDVLYSLYHHVQEQGVIVFDEYFSYKYPGARMAVDEFFADKSGWFEVYDTNDTFERWCFIKQSNNY